MELSLPTKYMAGHSLTAVKGSKTDMPEERTVPKGGQCLILTCKENHREFIVLWKIFPLLPPCYLRPFTCIFKGKKKVQIRVSCKDSKQPNHLKGFYAKIDITAKWSSPGPFYSPKPYEVRPSTLGETYESWVWFLHWCFGPDSSLADMILCWT